jgi:hypothetical protein
MLRSAAAAIVFCMAAAVTSVSAAETPRSMSLAYCEEDRVRYCGDRKGFPDISSCLIEHDRDVTRECKQELERFIQMRRQTLSGGGVLSPFGTPSGPLISYDGRYSPAHSSSYSENKLHITSPVHTSETDSTALFMTGTAVHVGAAPLLDSGKPVPSDLYRVELGSQYFRKLPDNRNWGVRGSVGSAGDKPFARFDELTFTVNANYGFPGSENGYWKLNLFISNNSPIGNYIPIPGFGYLYKTESFTGLFGFPVLSIQWTPLFPWSFSLGILGPNIQTEAAYGSIDRFQLFSGFYWTRQNYIPSVRDHVKDRLTLEEKKAAVGLRTLIGGAMLAELQLGQAFDRGAYIGNGPLNKDGGSASIPSDWYVSTAIKLRY